jgi:hypothetical protein
MLEIEKDQDQAAFRQGLFVRALGRPLGDNPYAPGSLDGRLWAEGWRLIDTRRPGLTRYDSPPLRAPASEFIPRAPTKLFHQRMTRKAGSPPQSFLVYLAFAVAFGGFFLMIFLSIEGLTR